jgi:hypothetical protein
MGAIGTFDQNVATCGLLLGNSLLYLVDVGESAEGALYFLEF